ncbi:MAG TPA: sulfate permease [Acidimicrobiia bacterium]|nr:sulfate permease [Acidimicrobiia bacterium]
MLEWVRGYQRDDLVPDVVAGITGATILVPQSMAYASIAGLPPVVGLYASVVPVLAYALFGRSRQLSVGPLATISIIGAVALAKLAPAGSSRYVTYAATLALLVGAIHLALGLGRLGFLMRFLSEPLMAGFISAVGVIIITTQLGPLFGFSVPQESLAYETVYQWAKRLDQVDWSTLAIGLATIVILLVARRRPRLPTALALVIAGSLAVLAFGLQDEGIAVVGHVPSGLAGPAVPPLDWDVVRTLLPAAFAITFVGFLESITLTREYARKHHYDVTTDGELVALGVANASAGLFQGMIVTGAVTRSSIVDAAGARTQLSGVVTALVVAPLLIFVPEAFSDIPIAVLAGIVIAAVIGFVKVTEARRLWRVKRSDFWIMMLAFVSTVGLGLEFGVLLTTVASLVLIIYRVTQPRIPELGRLPGTDAFVELSRHPAAETFPGSVIIRPESPLVYTSAESIEHRLEALGPDVHTVVLDASGVNDVDATGDHALRLVAQRLHERGVRLLLVNVHDDVRDVLDASGLSAILGDDCYFASDEDAVAHLEGRADP